MCYCVHVYMYYKLLCIEVFDVDLPEFLMWLRTDISVRLVYQVYQFWQLSLKQVYEIQNGQCLVWSRDHLIKTSFIRSGCSKKSHQHSHENFKSFNNQQTSIFLYTLGTNFHLCTKTTNTYDLLGLICVAIKQQFFVA